MEDISYVLYLLGKYKSTTIIDTNLFILLIADTCDIRTVGRGRTEKFSAEDYKLMRAVFDCLDRIIITPNIMTEVDNLARHLPLDKGRPSDGRSQCMD